MIRLFKEVDFKDKYLIIPSVSVGNIGQLAIDLLISSLQLEKIGTVWSTALIPIIGTDPYNTNSDLLSTACELYTSPGGNFVVLQIRSGIDKKYAKVFLSNLCELIQEHKFREVILLTSCFAFEKHNIQSSPFRYIANEAMLSEHSDKFQSLGWVALEKNANNSANDAALYTINGGGFALKLFQELTCRKIKTLLIMKYCSEGDNVPDSLDIVKYLDDYLRMFDNLNQQITFPPSWDLLFGGPPPIGIY